MDKPSVRFGPIFRSPDVAWVLVFDPMTIYDIMRSRSCLAVLGRSSHGGRKTSCRSVDDD